MGIEIERKFLVKDDAYRKISKPTLYRQGYMCKDPKSVVRVRVYENKGFITIKSHKIGFTRSEFEYDIPYEDALFMLDNLCYKPIIEKYRYKIKVDDVVWEVDEFVGVNEGLVIAEIELSNENQSFSLPVWIDKEVTGDPRYHNSNLVINPFSLW